MRTNILQLIPLLCITMLLTISFADTARSQSKNEAQATAVSRVKPPQAEFVTKPVPLPYRAPVASRGGCEPRYKKGNLTGTCINNKPCRGFGVLEDGRTICTCFAKRGGCDVGHRCDARHAQCVPEEEEPFNIVP